MNKDTKVPQETAGNAVNEGKPTFHSFIPLDSPQVALPSFPIDSLPSVIRRYVTAVAENSQTAVEMPGVISLGVLAATLQGKYCVQAPNGHTEPLNLYITVVANPGERKSSVMHAMANCLRDYENDFNAKHKAEILQNQQEREALERKITRLKRKLEQKADDAAEAELSRIESHYASLPTLVPRRFVADDCTAEALTKLMAQNDGIMSVISEEGGILDNMGGRYSNGQAQFDVLLKGYCGDSIYVDRIGRAAENIKRPTLTVILAIQPVVMEQILQNSAMTGRGLLARILFCSPVSKIGHRSFFAPAIPAAVKVAYTDLTYSLMSIPLPEDPYVLTLTAEASEIMEAYFAVHEQYLGGAGQAIPDWSAKYIGTVMRIAGLLHCATMADTEDCCIDATVMMDAIRIGEYLLAQANFMLSSFYDDKCVRMAKFVWGKIIEMRSREFKRSDLFQACRGKYYHKADELLPTLELLQEHGYIQQITPDHQGPGRPPDVRIIVNPAAQDTEI